MADIKINADFIYPIGSIYMSINSTDPGTIFGGTWEQIKDDAYLKIVTDKGGELGGTSKEHKIPIESMPSHNHAVSYFINSQLEGGYDKLLAFGSKAKQPSTTGAVDWVHPTGGSQPYYPYYYGIFLWVRTA